MHSSKSESLEAENDIGMETGTCGQPRTFRPQLGVCGCGAIQHRRSGCFRPRRTKLYSAIRVHHKNVQQLIGTIHAMHMKTDHSAYLIPSYAYDSILFRAV
jgi:hypothetical protein